MNKLLLGSCAMGLLVSNMTVHGIPRGLWIGLVASGGYLIIMQILFACNVCKRL